MPPKRFLPVLAAALLLLQGMGRIEATTVEAGMTEAEVVARIGEPMGSIRLRDKNVLMYPRGEITLVDGRVIEADLLDPGTFAEQQERMERERAEWAIEQEKLKRLREAEGRETKQAKLQSPAFAALPPGDRLRYWRNFQNRYPEIDVTTEIVAARESYEAEAETLRREREIEELRKEVAEARREAAAARLEAERLRRKLNDRRYYHYPVYAYPYPSRPTIWIGGNRGNRPHHDGKHEHPHHGGADNEPEPAPRKEPPGSVTTRNLPGTLRLTEIP